MWDEADITGLRRDLLTWFAGSKRDLPWRKRDSLYGIWVAEIMLQQTTVNTVTPFYRRFMARFPDVHTLAGAELDEVLTLWSGLGYYRRARMLHEAARLIVYQHQGQLPQSRDQWAKLPGVGAYASGSIASLGLGERVPALDANAKRVLVRWRCADAACAGRLKGKTLERLAAEAVDPDTPGDWNEAVMELGALVCRARDPLCRQCPVRRWCRAGVAGSARTVPPPARAEEPVPCALAQLVVAVGNRVLLVPAGTPPVAVPVPPEMILRGDLGSLHRGLWGLPTTPWLIHDAVFPDDPGLWWRTFVGTLPGEVSKTAPVIMGVVRHAITRFRLQVQVHLLRFADEAHLPPRLRPPALGTDQGTPMAGTFHERPLAGLPVSRLTAKVLGVAFPSQG